MQENITQIGHILAPFGIQGACKIYTLGDPYQAVHVPRLYIEGHGWLKVQQAEVHPPALVVLLLGISSRDSIEKMRNCKVYAHDDDLPALEEGSYYYYQLVGLPVQAPDGSDLGKVKQIFDLGYQDMLEVQKGLKNYWVPLQAPYVEIHFPDKIVLDAPEGLVP